MMGTDTRGGGIALLRVAHPPNIPHSTAIAPTFEPRGTSPTSQTNMSALLIKSRMFPQCPLWVKSGHGAIKLRCPLYLQKQTFIAAIGMSAKGHKRTDAVQQLGSLLDHFIGKGEQIVGYLDAERLGRLHVDDAEKLGFLHDRQVCRFGAFKHLPSIDASLTIGVGVVDPIADKAANFCVFTELVNRRDRVGRRKRYELLASSIKERIGSDRERRKSRLDDRPERRVDLIVVARPKGL